MSIRKELVLKVLGRERSVAELCRDYGVSRKTAYKWLRRFQERGVDGLADEGRRPDRSPAEIDGQKALEILRVRQQHPMWGARKLQRLLARGAGDADAVPSERTIARVLERAQVVRRRRQRRPCYGRPLHAPQVTVEQPNDLWTADFKGWWRTRDGARFEPLTVRDACSRYVLVVRVLDRNGTDEVRAVFEELFERNGLPKAMQTDNGQPFACTKTLAGLTRLSAWWVSLGIQLVRGRPGCPQDNGAHERMHADIRRELEDRNADSRPAQQLACDEWRAEFNHVRPHEALAFKTPADVYRPSARRLHHVVGDRLPEGCYVARLNDAGQAYYGGQRIYVATTLAGLFVGLKAHGDRVRVWFHDLLLGHYDPSQGRRVTVVPLDEPEVSPPKGLQIATAGVTLCSVKPPGEPNGAPEAPERGDTGVTLSAVAPGASSEQHDASPTESKPDPGIDPSDGR